MRCTRQGGAIRMGKAMSELYYWTFLLALAVMVSMIFPLCPGFASSDTSGRNVYGYAG